ncbi:VOC family protein [Autumnicola musiva]|uniref:VOC family protein n=1 Tax=Autumnicola musiva TaxID=3075589 RepID=A0ABU3DAU7_9FLAO|nr:VOC family protein [Zunongwangia sp. F117]MDT0678093.1 VOC family protein [Zunongwangia sp. F117]
MKNRLGRLIILVRDYEKSAAFYEEIFEFERIFDMTTDKGQRFLQLGDKENNVGVWLLKAEGQEQEARIGNQTAGQPTLVIYTDDLSKIFHRLKSLDYNIKLAPSGEEEYNFLHCFDYDGNEIVAVELKEDPPN